MAVPDAPDGYMHTNAQLCLVLQENTHHVLVAPVPAAPLSPTSAARAPAPLPVGVRGITYCDTLRTSVDPGVWPADVSNMHPNCRYTQGDGGACCMQTPIFAHSDPQATPLSTDTDQMVYYPSAIEFVLEVAARVADFGGPHKARFHVYLWLNRAFGMTGRVRPCMSMRGVLCAGCVRFGHSALCVLRCVVCFAVQGMRRPLSACCMIVVQSLLGVSNTGYRSGTDGHTYDHAQWVQQNTVANGECVAGARRDMRCKGDGDAIQGQPYCAGCMNAPGGPGQTYPVTVLQARAAAPFNPYIRVPSGCIPMHMSVCTQCHNMPTPTCVPAFPVLHPSPLLRLLPYQPKASARVSLVMSVRQPVARSHNRTVRSRNHARQKRVRLNNHSVYNPLTICSFFIH